MRFHYSFQKVVDLKTNEKKLAESGLSQAFGALTAMERELAELTGLKESVQQQLVLDTSESVPIADVLAKQQYVNHLEDAIRAAVRKIRDAEFAVEAQRQQLKEKSIDEKIWISARGKAEMRHLTMMAKLEQSELDEIATIRSRKAR